MLLGLQPGPRVTFCPWTSILCESWSSQDCPVCVCQDLDSTGHVCPIHLSAHLGQWVVDLVSVLAAHCGICCGMARVELTRRDLVCKPREQKQRSQPGRNWKKHEVHSGSGRSQKRPCLWTWQWGSFDHDSSEPVSNMCTQHEIGVLWYWRLKQEGWRVL